MEMEGALSGQRDLAGLFGGHHALVNRRTPPSQLGWSLGVLFFVGGGAGAVPLGAPGGKLPSIKIIPSAQLEVLLGVKCG